jgi:hypothetical protein
MKTINRINIQVSHFSFKAMIVKAMIVKAMIVFVFVNAAFE